MSASNGVDSDSCCGEPVHPELAGVMQLKNCDMHHQRSVPAIIIELSEARAAEVGGVSWRPLLAETGSLNCLKCSRPGNYST